jgi:hypothetical protein
MKIVKVVTMDDNGEITRELTMKCVDNATEARLFHALLTAAVKLSDHSTGIVLDGNRVFSTHASLSSLDTAEEVDVPLEGV